MVVAQWLERSAVAREVAGSNPVSHPKFHIPFTDPMKKASEDTKRAERRVFSFSAIYFVSAIVLGCIFCRSRYGVLTADLAFNSNLRDTGTKLGLSHKEFAAISGVHRTHIGMIERAERNITLSNIEKLARALRISVSSLLHSL